jgi:AcrR family transcriptional regulator
VQARSAERVQRMLDACAHLILEVGYEQVTTTLIARRAKVAIGSLYQFFPDKTAVASALVDRNVERYLTELGSRLAAAPPQQWWEAVDTAMDLYVELHHADPGFRALHFGDVVDTHLLDPGQDNNAAIAERLGSLMLVRFGLPPSRQLTLALTVAVEIADALLKLAFRQAPDDEAEVVAQAKDVIRTYLSQHLPG